MKNFIFVIICQSPYHSLFQTLSLQNVNQQAEKVWIVHPPTFVLPDYPIQLHSFPIIQEDLGCSLNQLLKINEAQYALLMFSGVRLSIEEWPQQPFDVSGNQDIVFLKPSICTLHPFPEKHSIPFQEALFASWLTSLPKEVTTEPIQTKIEQKVSTSQRAKRAFAAKYIYPQKQSTLPITVVIANYNHAETIDNAISSCLAGSIIPEQIFIVDDASTDSSREHISRWQLPTIKNEYLEQNGGKARALNSMLPHIQSEYIMELDPDDWLDPNAFSELAKRMSSWPLDSALLYGNLRKWKMSTDHQLHFKGVTKGRQIESTNELLSYRHPLGPRIYRTQSLRIIGGFPELDYENGRLYEDVAVLYKLIKLGPLTHNDFTIYNVRNHKGSITQKNHAKWDGFLRSLKDWS